MIKSKERKFVPGRN